MERLQKIIAAAGIASRRKAEELIASGRVQVNGKIVTALGTKADPQRDHIRVAGKLISAPEPKVHLLLYKPKGYVTTVSDPEGRPTVMDLVRGAGARIYPVGRLDWGSEGLLLMTNDGELAHLLTRAASHVPKTYMVKVSGRPTEAAISKLRSGVTIVEEKQERGRPKTIKTAPARIQLARSATNKEAPNPWYEVTLIEGRNRQIRRMFEQVGHHVEKIKRIRYGPLHLDMEPGKFRKLTPNEVAALRKTVRPQAPTKSHAGPPATRTLQE